MAKQSVFEHGRLSRRHFLQGSTVALGVASTLPLSTSLANTPQAGGTARIRGWDPVGWDPFRTWSFRTHVALSFTHNRLFRYKAGPDVEIGTMIVEPDLVERWEEPSDTRYIFHLRKGVRFHDKPPVGGREMVAEDVRLTFERFLTQKGNENSRLFNVAEVKALDKYTVQVDLESPHVWFLDHLAEASTVPIMAKEVLDKYPKSLKKPETVVGTGPWLLDSYTPRVEVMFKKHPNYFREGMPYLDNIHYLIMEDGATATAAYMAEKLDIAPGIRHTIGGRAFRSFREKHPDWYYKGFRPSGMSFLAMRSDQAPFNDERVRQAVSMAMNRKGSGKYEKWRRENTAVPAGLKEWHLPVDQLGDAAKYYQYNPDEAKRLLSEAGHPNGFETPMLVHSGYSPLWSDYIERVTGWLGDVGIKVSIVDKEYGAYIRLLTQRKYDGMAMLLSKAYVTPDGFVYGRYAKDNISHVDDAELRELSEAQRREKDVKKRKAIIDELSRLAAVKQYYIYLNSWPRVASWQPYVMNFNTNLDYDYGGRLQSAWLAKL
ncbi:ABC transporter substrate-binding protein [Candidatus Entotheonella palauensis]|uniref:ABC transporter substrate-binding protein n=1 Tax=Candidatus Entotheonella palauensis TaxID=93172 RepID=UPI000B7DD18C|nr:ABC transporter substrate-binding protein [Candidatus Entotheonella palauensis]